MISSRNILLLLILVALTSILIAWGCSGPTSPDDDLIPAAIISMDSVTTLPGAVVTLPLRITYTDGGKERLDTLDGFELMIEYNTNELFFLGGMDEGDGISEWEYFTYRRGPKSECSECPEDIVRVIGVRDLDNGLTPATPQVYAEGIVTSVSFQVTSDYNYTGTTASVKFSAIGCDGCALVSQVDRNVHYIADSRFGPSSADAAIDSAHCARRDVLIPLLEFQHGQVTIEMPESGPGDVNLDGYRFGVSDLVVFTELWRGDTSSLDPIWGYKMIENADCNGDGIPLTISDYEYILQVVMNNVNPDDSLPTPNTETLNLELTVDGSDWLLGGSSSSPVGGLRIKCVEPDGGELGAEWLGNQFAGFSAGFALDTLTIVGLTDYSNFEPILEGDWPPSSQIISSNGKRPRIVWAEASTPPGVSMQVIVDQ